MEDTISENLTNQAKDVLSFGPGFVQARRVNRNMVQDVEVACERMAFGYRWKKHIEHQKNQQMPRPEQQRQSPQEVPVSKPQSQSVPVDMMTERRAPV